MKDWYVQEGRFTPLENNLIESIESYTFDEENDRIITTFSYQKKDSDAQKIGDLIR